MVPRNNKGYGFIKKRTKTEESTFISDIPGLEDFHLDCVRKNSTAHFKESILELSKHVVQVIDYGGNKLAASIQNHQMVVIVVPDKVADNDAEITQVIQKIWLGD